MVQVCNEHKELHTNINDIKTDIAIIKQRLVGDTGKKNGIVDKVEKHDMYFYIVYGMIILMGFAIANINLIK